MGGIKSVRMSNPEANCEVAGAGGGRYDNIVDIYWKTTAAASIVTGWILQSYAASQIAKYGYAAHQPARFRGILRAGQSYRYSTSYGATPRKNYDIRLMTGTNAKDRDLAASLLCNQLCATQEQQKVLTAKYVDQDIYLTVRNCGASSTLPGGRIRLWFD